MKKVLTLAAFVAAGFVFSGQAFAQSTGTFDVQASVPKAVSIEFITYESGVTGPNNDLDVDFNSNPGTTLNFDSANNFGGQGELVYDTVNNVWTAPTFFVIDFAGVSAAGQPAPPIYNNVSFSYSDTNNPNANGGRTGVRGQGLGDKVLATVLQWDFSTTPQFIEQVSQSTLNSIPSFTNADVVDGTARVVLSVADGNPDVPVGTPFTNGDLPGAYTGTLTITAVLD